MTIILPFYCKPDDAPMLAGMRSRCSFLLPAVFVILCGRPAVTCGQSTTQDRPATVNMRVVDDVRRKRYPTSGAAVPIQVMADTAAHRIIITAGGKPFTAFIYPDTLEKPVLYPVYASDGQLVTRGFPLVPRTGEPVDHPHHIGIWFNYENVNGLDFWNNSYAIPADKKAQYGWIRTDSVGADGPNLHYSAR